MPADIHACDHCGNFHDPAYTDCATGSKSIGGDTKYAKCPTCGFATIYKGAPATDAFEEVLIKCRGYLAQHTCRADKKARLLIQEIDVFLLAR
jgi:DNA-directed RNA polymerase subunit RPC12/RpoP